MYIKQATILVPMKLARLISVFLLTLSLSFGSAMSISLAAQQAITMPCAEPMDHCPCCKDRCDSTIMSCSVQCPMPSSTVIFLEHTQPNRLAIIQFFALNSYSGSQFASGPPPPIPI